MESEAVLLILRRMDGGDWVHVSSEMARAEILAVADPGRRKRILEMLPPPDDILVLDEAIFRRAEQLRRLGLRPADAVHVAAAEVQRAAAFLTCDDQLLRAARRHATDIKVPVTDPVSWVKDRE
jgi:predicted nucleic acid-binding protein